MLLGVSFFDQEPRSLVRIDSVQTTERRDVPLNESIWSTERRAENFFESIWCAERGNGAFLESILEHIPRKTFERIHGKPADGGVPCRIFASGSPSAFRLKSGSIPLGSQSYSKSESCAVGTRKADVESPPTVRATSSRLRGKPARRFAT